MKIPSIFKRGTDGESAKQEQQEQPVEQHSVETLAIRAALKKMIDDGWINISTIDQCLKIAQVSPPGREYALLRTLHCVSFTQMEPALARQVPQMIMSLFEKGMDTKVMQTLFDKWEKALPAPAGTQ